MAAIQEYVRVQSVSEALRELQRNPAARLVAGGTDFLLKGVGRAAAGPVSVVDISDVPDLNGIEISPLGIRIGACTRLSEIAGSKEINQNYPVLAQGALAVGSPQIRNMATLGGNLCNAAPSADTATPLLAMDAVVEIESPEGKRALPLEKFFLGPGQTVMTPFDILTAVLVHLPAPGAFGAYLKHSPRQALDLAIAAVAVMVWRMDSELQVRIALGAVAPTPIRARKAEKFAESRECLDDAEILETAAIAAGEASPISDVRATAAYRRDMVRVLVNRASNPA